MLHELLFDALFVNAKPLHEPYAGIDHGLNVERRFVAAIRNDLHIFDVKTNLLHVVEKGRKAGNVID